MEFTFVIPEKPDELWSADGNKYCVSSAYSENEVGQALKGK